MNARAKAPVEPLSRAAWDRVESGLFARVAQGEHRLFVPAEPRLARSPLWWAVAVAAAAAAVIGLNSLPSSLAEPPAAAPPLAVRVEPPPATHIATTDAPTRTTIGEATLTLGAHSEMRLSGSDAQGWLVLLDRGAVDCEVAPRHGRPPFVVQAGETRVTVVGTRFSVRRDGSEQQVQVREGHVHVQSGVADLMLGPGETWPNEPPTISSDSLPEVRAPARPAQLRALRPRAFAHDRASQFASAARLEASDPEAAIARYRQLAAGKGPWAANALYAQARLELERGRTARAATLLRRYREHHPRGTNAADVEALLQRLESAGP